MISSTYIRDYLLKKFQGKYKLISGERELTIPSLFLDHDPKRHMSVNLDSGLWQCFKSGEKGNFLHLFARLENISYKDAYKRFLVEEFFSEPVEAPAPESPPERLPEDFSQAFSRVDISSFDEVNSAAALFLIDRRITHFGDFYYTTDGPYRNRLIIPYDNGRNIYYFQARSLFGQEPKYLNFRGIKSSAILFPFKYDSKDPLYICEGAIDAISLQLAGFNATTTISCHVSKAQLEQLKYYQGKIVVAYDNDRAGTDGLRSFELLRRHMRMPQIYYCFPPKKYKDWNEAWAVDPTALLTAVKTTRLFEMNEWDIMSGLSTLDL
jgi:5S rRNA maturation endonuclease (ribonuclease M5)